MLYAIGDIVAGPYTCQAASSRHKWFNEMAERDVNNWDIAKGHYKESQRKEVQR
jgi:hypothetical protein